MPRSALLAAAQRLHLPTPPPRVEPLPTEPALERASSAALRGVGHLTVPDLRGALIERVAPEDRPAGIASLIESPPGAARIQASDSRRSPTSDGVIGPLLCRPTDINTFSSRPGVNGSSAASPASRPASGRTRRRYAAGAATWLMLEPAPRFKDWGSSQADNLFGSGGATLRRYHPGTIWLAPGYGNTGNLVSAPATTLEAAAQQVAAGSRVLAFPDGTFEPEVDAFAADFLLDSLGGTAVLP